MKITIWLAGGVILLTANMSSAQPGPGMGGRQGHSAMMSNIDLNGDGVVSAAEQRQWAEKVFATMDANDDETLSREEYLAVHMGRGPGAGGNEARMQAMRQQADARKAERFSAMDVDKNGFATRSEFLADADRNFAAKDTNNDGKLSASEFRSWRNQR
jgi:Ca2+-binding EF-hand superfamily protein